MPDRIAPVTAPDTLGESSAAAPATPFPGDFAALLDTYLSGEPVPATPTEPERNGSADSVALVLETTPPRPPAEFDHAPTPAEQELTSPEENENPPAATVGWDSAAAAALAATQVPVRLEFEQAVGSASPLVDEADPGNAVLGPPQEAPLPQTAEPGARAHPPELPPAVAAPREAVSSSSEPARDSAVAEAVPAPGPTESEPVAPWAVAGAHPAVAGPLAKVLEQARSWSALGEAAETVAPRPVPPASELAFAAKLTHAGSERARSELLAVLTSAGPAAQYPDTAPPRLVPALESEPVPAAEPPARAPAPPASAERPQTLSLAIARGQPWHELPKESRTAPRSVALLGHPVHAEAHAPPVAPYRAPEFVASQPGTRTPWSAVAEPRAHFPDAPPSPVHDLSLLIPPRADEGGPQEPVSLRILERAGEVKVAVHTRDVELAQSLRAQLGDLVESLERSGYRTATWKPGEPPQENIRPQDVAAERDAAGDGRGDQPGSGHHPPRQQRQRQQDQPRWAESLAATALGRGAALDTTGRRN